jgi:hypothetical protein
MCPRRSGAASAQGYVVLRCVASPPPASFSFLLSLRPTEEVDTVAEFLKGTRDPDPTVPLIHPSSLSLSLYLPTEAQIWRCVVWAAHTFVWLHER